MLRSRMCIQSFLSLKYSDLYYISLGVNKNLTKQSLYSQPIQYTDTTTTKTLHCGFMCVILSGKVRNYNKKKKLYWYDSSKYTVSSTTITTKYDESSQSLPVLINKQGFHRLLDCVVDDCNETGFTITLYYLVDII